MKYYLYTFQDNWADEMDLEGFAILTEKEKDTALAQIKKRFKRGGTICFGTNEDNEYDSLDDVMDCVEFKEITAVEYNAIKKAFGNTTFGETGPLDRYSFEEEDDDERTCEECGSSLTDDEDEICNNCKEEDEEEMHEAEYNSSANEICDFIKREYGLEESESYGYHSRFIWKPTPNTELEITIGEYGEGNEDVEFNLKHRNRNIGYESFPMEDVDLNDIRTTIKELIKTAKKY